MRPVDDAGIVFCCGRCMQTIHPDEAVYMHCDQSYCSAACRHKAWVDNEEQLLAASTEHGSSETCAAPVERMPSGKRTGCGMGIRWVLDRVVDSVSSHLPLAALLPRADSHLLLDELQPGRWLSNTPSSVGCFAIAADLPPSGSAKNSSPLMSARSANTSSVCLL
mmetsp:Transcript_109811/g.321556  ORF Transcript_109811/g.321556 Transcript_109811/m.321556 type:complete len:165 (+) Transcript_109811:46-540(+)